MSSRALRKLQQQQELEAEKARAKSREDNKDDDEEEDSEEHPAIGAGSHRGARAKMPRNPFDLLNNESCSESEVKEDDDLGTESSRSLHGASNKGGDPTLKGIDLGSIAKAKKKKKTKNRKRMGKLGNIARSSEDNLEMDEIERSVNEVNRMLGDPDDVNTSGVPSSKKGGTRSKGSSESDARAVLNIETKLLNPENEMKKIFGSRVVMENQRDHRAPHNMMHHGRRGRGNRGIGQHHRSTRTSHSLIAPKPTWPNPGKTGLTMKFLDSDKSGNQYFTFDHNSAYQAVQRQFFDAVESMNPDFIVQILNSHPFHVDSMLQLSDICKMGEDNQMATELIERSLYAMESAFHPLFNLAVGTSRLDYKRQENRAFYLALFRHLNYVGSRACYRTALELCKLMLSLDPSGDPLGVTLMIDFYALRANQHAWLLRFYTEWEAAGRNLSQLPNFAYAVAVGYFYSANQVLDGKPNVDEALMELANDALQNALIMFPGVLLPLLDKCSIDADKKASGHPFFLDAQAPPDSSSIQSRGLAMLCALYVGRSFHIWKDPDLLPWLEQNVSKVMERVDSKSDPFVQDCEEKRKVRYQGTPRNIHRHIAISDIKEATSALPRELANIPVLSYDPLPPSDSINIYTEKDKNRGAGSIDDPSAFRMFFRSLLPNYNPNDPNPQRADGGGQVEGAEGGGDLRRSVTTLLDAMQDLLGGLHLPEIPNDGAASADSENDDDDWQ